MLALSSAVNGLTSPSSALDAWRSSRLLAWSRSLDRRFDSDYRAFGKVRTDLRYRTQILVIDETGMHARLCECILDRLCEDVDADVDAMACSLDAVKRPPPAIRELSASLGLSSIPMQAGGRTLRPSDLLATSRWDVILTTDLAVLERVRGLARAVNAVDRTGGSLGTDAGWRDAKWAQMASHPSGLDTDTNVLCLTDFLSRAVPPTPVEDLPAELAALLASREEAPSREEEHGEAGRTPAADLAGDLLERHLVDLPATQRSDAALQARGCDSDSLKQLATVATACCAASLTYLQAVMREHATRQFTADLTASVRAAGSAPCNEWTAVRALLAMEHGVPGGLSEDEMEAIWEEHVRERAAGSAAGANGDGRASGRPNALPRVDVSDLGLTMDDLSGPMGGLG
jgi:hypothetical protein